MTSVVMAVTEKVITVLLLLVFAVESSPPYQYFYNPHSGQFEVTYQTQPQQQTQQPAYVFNYGVRDPLTGDVKSQWEQRDGDLVRGHYSVIDPDGSLRSVHYTSGRNAGYKKLRGSKGRPLTTVAKPLIAYSKPSIKSIYKSPLSLPASRFPALPSLPDFPSWYFTGDNGNSLVQPEIPPPSQVHNPGPVLFPQNPADDTTVTPDPNQTSGVTPPPPQFIPPKSHESLRDQIFRRPETLPQPSPQPPAISQLTSNLLYTPATFAYVRK